MALGTHEMTMTSGDPLKRASAIVGGELFPENIDEGFDFWFRTYFSTAPAVEKIIELIADVKCRDLADVNCRNLSADTVNSLTSTLEAAAAALEQDNVNAGINKLIACLNKLDGQSEIESESESDKQISQNDAREVGDKARRTIASL